MGTRIGFIFSLVLVWLGLTATSLVDINWLQAIIVVALVSAVSIYLQLFSKNNLFKLNFVVYGFWLVKEIFLSAWTVTKIIWSKQIKLKPAKQLVDVADLSDMQRILYANSITLTPGTVSLDLQEQGILVHGLDQHFLTDLHNGPMKEKIKQVIKC